MKNQIKKISFALMSFAMIACSAHAQPGSKDATVQVQADMDWKMNLLALQVEERVEVDCNGHHLAAEDMKSCVELRTPWHASKIALISGLRPPGMSEAALADALIVRAEGIYATLSN